MKKNHTPFDVCSWWVKILHLHMQCISHVKMLYVHALHFSISVWIWLIPASQKQESVRGLSACISLNTCKSDTGGPLHWIVVTAVSITAIAAVVAAVVVAIAAFTRRRCYHCCLLFLLLYFLDETPDTKSRHACCRLNAFAHICHGYPYNKNHSAAAAAHTTKTKSLLKFFPFIIYVWCFCLLSVSINFIPFHSRLIAQNNNKNNEFQTV